MQTFSKFCKGRDYGFSQINYFTINNYSYECAFN